MSSESFRSPRFLSIGLGIALFVLFLLAMCSLSQGVKWVGSALLFLPDRLGLVQTATPAEVFRFDITRSPTQVKFVRAGLYQVYTSDYDLLVISDQLAQSDSPPWITVTAASGGAQAEVSHITRGLLPQDTPHAAGRPVIEIVITQPGDYLLDYPTRMADVSIVPDYSTGREAMIYGSFAVQGLILALPFALLFYRREQRLWRRSAETRMRSVEKFERIRRLARGRDAGNKDSHGPSKA